MDSIKRFFNWIVQPSANKTDAYLVDDVTGEKWSLLEHLNCLERRIEILEQENIETTNTLYEILNRLDSMDQSEYNLKNFTLGDH